MKIGKFEEFNGGKWEFVREIEDLWEKIWEIIEDLSEE